MTQIFPRYSNTLARLSLVILILLATICGWALHAVYFSPYTTRVDLPLRQTVPFSHKHHVQGLGIDCRFCHTSVETSSSAGLPATEICMTCHSQLFTEAPLLAPVRESLANSRHLVWNRVNDVPDFVFFNHSIHVAKGIGCATCHGPVERMPLAWKQNTLYMRWCLQCHEDPARYLRPKEQVFNQAWVATNQLELGQELVARYHIQVTQLSDCSRCHR